MNEIEIKEEAEIFAPIVFGSDSGLDVYMDLRKGFIEGAKWMQLQLSKPTTESEVGYSKYDMKACFKEGHLNGWNVRNITVGGDWNFGLDGLEEIFESYIQSLQKKEQPTPTQVEWDLEKVVAYAEAYRFSSGRISPSQFEEMTLENKENGFIKTSRELIKDWEDKITQVKEETKLSERDQSLNNITKYYSLAKDWFSVNRDWNSVPIMLSSFAEYMEEYKATPTETWWNKVWDACNSAGMKSHEGSGLEQVIAFLESLKTTNNATPTSLSK